MKYIVIGNGVTGTSAVQVLSKEKTSDSTITQFSDESFTYYLRPKIPAFIGNSNMTIDDIISYNFDWYRNLQVDIHIQEKVRKIDYDSSEVVTQKGSYPFDRLLIATGADCWCPPIEGRELDHFYTIRSLSDALKIRKRLKSSKKAVIIGGGVLGLEIATASINQNQDTTILEFSPHLLPRQLDEEGSKILQQILENRGMDIFVGKEVKKVIGRKKVEYVRTKDGMEFPADLVMICTGIKSRTGLVKGSLETNRGILVNDYLETSMKNIYAAGDCAEHNGRVYGLVPPSIQQARIAAKNMINYRSESYNGSKISSTLKITDIILSSFGYTGRETKFGYEVRKYVSDKEYVKIFINKDKIVAAIILGVEKPIPLIRTLFNQEKLVSENESEIRKNIPDLS